MLLVMMFGMGSLSTILAGIPEYESLDVVIGSLVDVRDCTKGRGATYLPVTVNSNGNTASLLLPCTSELKSLKNKLGSTIEIRTRLFSGHLIDVPETEVWGVKTNNAEVYSYTERVKRYNNTKWINIILLIIYGLLLVYLFKGVISKKAVELNESP